MFDIGGIFADTMKGLASSVEELAHHQFKKPTDGRPRYTILVEEYDRLIRAIDLWSESSENFEKGGRRTFAFSVLNLNEKNIYRAALHYVAFHDRLFWEEIISKGEPYPVSRLEKIIEAVRRKSYEMAGNPKPIGPEDIGKRIYARDIKRGKEVEYVVDEILIELIDENEILFPVDDHIEMSQKLAEYTDKVIEEGRKKGWATD